MFKNMTIFRLRSGLPEFAALEANMDGQQFVPCAPTQQLSCGWVPPRGHEHDAMLEAVGGHWFARLRVETRTVPAQALAKEVRRLCTEYEQQTGHKPGRKVVKEMKEEALLNLLPRAFPASADIQVWFDVSRGVIAVDTHSKALAVDVVLSSLQAAAPDAKTDYVVTELSPSAVMTSWLVDGEKLDDADRWGFSIGRGCELRSTDENKAVVRYKNHSLDIPEIVDHIQQGKVVVKLDVAYRDHVSMTLTQEGVLTALQFDVPANGGEDDDKFDADAAIMTGEMQPLIADLIEALGGELVAEGGAQ